MKFKFHHLNENSITKIILFFQESSLMSLQSQCSWTKAWLIASTWCWLCCAVLIQVGHFYQIDRLSDSDCESWVEMRLCPNVSTTPLRQWGFRQCLPFSWTKLRGKHCRHPIAITFRQSNVTSPRTSPIRYCTVKQLHKLSVTLL